MTLTITDQLISSGHAVRSAPGRPHAWEVSWLPGQLLDRNTAITAMMLADTASDASERDQWAVPAGSAWSVP